MRHRTGLLRTPRRCDRGLVAVYDALLFLMVVILISVGMFLYTARGVGEGGQFSDDFHQDTVGRQLTMVEALSLNASHPMPDVTWSNGTASRTMSLVEAVGEPEARTVGWLVDSYVALRWKGDEANMDRNGTWDAEAILQVVDVFFSENRLPRTEHAWMVLYKGSEMLFGSSAAASLEELPLDRWAATVDHGRTDVAGGVPQVVYEAELRYFMWLA